MPASQVRKPFDPSNDPTSYSGQENPPETFEVMARRGLKIPGRGASTAKEHKGCGEEEEDTKKYGMAPGTGLAQSFTTPNHNGNLYNQENDKPANQKSPPGLQREKMANRHVGETINYNLGVGTVVEKRGMYITVANNDSKHVDTVHVDQTWKAGEMLENRLWDSMAMEARGMLLYKSKMPTTFIGRTWYQLPDVVKTHLELVSKTPAEGTTGSSDNYFEPSRGGFEGREPGKTRDEGETESYWDKTDTHPNDPPKSDKRQAQALQGLSGSTGAAVVGSHKATAFVTKSDVEHGMYGGITTDQEPLEAQEDYEERKREGRRANQELEDHKTGDKKTRIELEDKAEDDKCETCGSEAHTTSQHDVTKGEDCSTCGGSDHTTAQHDNISKEQQQAAITGKPDMELAEEKKDDQQQAAIMDVRFTCQYKRFASSIYIRVA